MQRNFGVSACRGSSFFASKNGKARKQRTFVKISFSFFLRKGFVFGYFFRLSSFHKNDSSKLCNFDENVPGQQKQSCTIVIIAISTGENGNKKPLHWV